jgi:hypothetical protein
MLFLESLAQFENEGYAMKAPSIIAAVITNCL